MSGRTRLLIVDDDPELRQSAVDALSDAGYETAVAGNGWEALAATQGPQTPQLILLDLMMPEMNGWQFREAQQRDARIKDIPLVVITASRDLVNHPIDADGVLLKPFGLDDLLGQVHRLVGAA
jgi:two-component system response regulator MprA